MKHIKLKNKFMSVISLQKRFVKTLCNYYENEGANLNREEFVSYLIKNVRLCDSFHLWLKNDNGKKLRRKVDIILGDCMEGELNYISYYDEQRTKLIATTRGRDFATSLGFLDEFIKRYGAIVLVLISGAFGYFIQAVITLIFNQLK